MWGWSREPPKDLVFAGEPFVGVSATAVVVCNASLVSGLAIHPVEAHSNQHPYRVGPSAVASVQRFAFISPNFYPRVCGIGDHTARLGQELRRRGHDVAVFTREPATRHPEAPDLEVHPIRGHFAGAIAERARRAIAAWQPTDVILQYSSQMWGAWRFGTVAPLWLTANAHHAGARVTLIAHELFVPWLPRPDLALASVIQRIQFAALLKSCHHVFVTTETRASYIAPTCRLLRLPAPGVLRVGANALPVQHSTGPDNGSRTEPRVGVFSTAAVGKRFDVVLDSFTRIAEEFPLAQLVLIGDLGSPERSRVREILDSARQHPVADRVRITGKLSLPQVATEIAALDVYLFPMSTGANTRSGTLPVALGSGLPVVAVRGSETDATIFQDGVNIVFADDLSAAAFADEALKLLRDPVLRTRLGQGARRLYDEHLTWSRIADHLLAEIQR